MSTNLNWTYCNDPGYLHLRCTPNTNMLVEVLKVRPADPAILQVGDPQSRQHEASPSGRQCTHTRNPHV